MNFFNPTLFFITINIMFNEYAFLSRYLHFLTVKLIYTGQQIESLKETCSLLIKLQVTITAK